MVNIGNFGQKKCKLKNGKRCLARSPDSCSMHPKCMSPKCITKRSLLLIPRKWRPKADGEQSSSMFHSNVNECFTSLMNAKICQCSHPSHLQNKHKLLQMGSLNILIGYIFQKHIKCGGKTNKNGV